MSIQPEGEELRKATVWISEQRQARPDVSVKKLVSEASLKFDLSPLEADFLDRTLTDQTR